MRSIIGPFNLYGKRPMRHKKIKQANMLAADNENGSPSELPKHSYSYIETFYY